MGEKTVKIDATDAARALGRLGRAVNSKAQQEAARLNGAKGGRPPKGKAKRKS